MALPPAVRLGNSSNLYFARCIGGIQCGHVYDTGRSLHRSVNIKIGNGLASAAATDTLITANAPPEYFIVSPGQNLAVIGAGTVNITEC